MKMYGEYGNMTFEPGQPLIWFKGQYTNKRREPIEVVFMEYRGKQSALVWLPDGDKKTVPLAKLKERET